MHFISCGGIFRSALIHFISCGGIFYFILLVAQGNTFVQGSVPLLANLGERHSIPWGGYPLRQVPRRTLGLFVLLESRDLSARPPQGCYPCMQHWDLSSTKQEQICNWRVSFWERCLFISVDNANLQWLYYRVKAYLWRWGRTSGI